MAVSNYTPILQQQMEKLGITSFRVLAKQAGVSLWQVTQLRRGHLHRMRLEILLQLCQVLELSLTDLITTFSEEQQQVHLEQAHLEQAHLEEAAPDQQVLRQEYQHLQQQMATHREMLLQEFQHNAFHTLESMLRALPTVAHAVQQKPDLTAATVLRLLRPIDQLLQQWGIEPIALPGTQVSYDPRWHQLSQGKAEPGDLVSVVMVGYRQGDLLLCRAGVKPNETAYSREEERGIRNEA